MTSFYVDNALGSSGNGTSWAQAWNSFASISWSAVKPGDTIYVSGGAPYSDALNVEASGTSSGSIIITNGIDPGHNAPVVIDGQSHHLASGVFVDGHDYVTLDGLSVRNIADSGFSVKNATAGVVLQNNSVYSGDPGGGNARGYDIRNSGGVIVRNNSFSTPSSTPAQTDGIWSSNNNGVVFEHNHIVISNSDTTGHSDGIQSFQDFNITVRDNWFEQANTATENNHGAWLSDARNGGLIQFYNNVVLTPNLTGDSAVTYWKEASWPENGTAAFWNNTIIGGHRAVNVDGQSGVQVKDNIIEPSSGGYAYFVANANPTAIDNNLIWAPTGQVANVSGVDKTWSDWQASGRDIHGINADPKSVNPSVGDYHLQSGSPAIDSGASIGAVPDDYAGVSRPQGSAFDIGAFESGAAATPTPTPTPPPGPVPVGQDTLSLILSEDRSRSGANVRFIARVDGVAIADTKTITALHRTGSVQEFDFLGSWGAGKHDIAIDFTNYARGMDLYIQQVKFNGSSYLTDTISVHRHGETHIIVGQ